MKKNVTKVFIAIIMIGMLFAAIPAVISANSSNPSCLQSTRSGTNRSGTNCDVHPSTTTPRRARLNWNHSQFRVWAEVHTVTNNYEARATVQNHFSTQHSAWARNATARNDVSIMRIALHAPASHSLVRRR